MNTAQDVKTCLITIVQPGLPDSVIKVRPAMVESEKIWLDRRQGIERWEAVKQLMRRFCPRGKYVPEPAYWNPPSAKQEDLNVVILKAEDIPLIELDGAILDAPEVIEHATRPKPNDAAKDAQDKISRLEDRLDSLTSSMAKMVEAMSNQQEPKKGPGRPRKED